MQAYACLCCLLPRPMLAGCARRSYGAGSLPEGQVTQPVPISWHPPKHLTLCMPLEQAQSRKPGFYPSCLATSARRLRPLYPGNTMTTASPREGRW